MKVKFSRRTITQMKALGIKSPEQQFAILQYLKSYINNRMLYSDYEGQLLYEYRDNLVISNYIHPQFTSQGIFHHFDVELPTRLIIHIYIENCSVG